MIQGKKRSILWQGLSAQLFFFVILPFALLSLAATFISIGLHQNAMRTMVAERDARAVVTAANFLASKIHSEEETAFALAMLMKNTPTDPAKAINDFVAAHTYTGKNLAIYSEDGQRLAFSGDASLLSALPTEVIMPTDLSVTKINGNSYLQLAHKVDSGGWVVNTVQLSDLARDVVDGMTGDMGMTNAYLLDSNKNILVSTGMLEPTENIQQHPGVAEGLQGQSGFTYVKIENAEHVLAYSPVGSLGWVLVFEEPWEAVETPTLKLTQLAPLVLLPLLGFTLVALWFSLSQIITPLQKLEKQAAELAWGDFSAIEKPVGGVREIKQLQNELVLMARKVRDSQQSLHGYIGAISRGQEEERHRLARELHDDTVQALIAIRQRILLAQLKTEDPDQKAAFEELAALSNTSITDLRRLTRALRPIYLEDFGLATALGMMAQETTDLPIQFSKIGDERRLKPEIELGLYRIAQEVLSNILRHAKARSAEIKLNYQPNSISMEICDDGVGFTPPRSPAEFAPAGHYGLLGIYERVEGIGGKLSIETETNKGSTIRVTLQA